MPPIQTQQKFWLDHLEVIKTYPNDDSAEVFGMHENALITGYIFQTNSMLNTILSLLPRNVNVD